jgi:hypothetical protein
MRLVGAEMVHKRSIPQIPVRHFAVWHADPATGKILNRYGAWAIRGTEYVKVVPSLEEARKLCEERMSQDFRNEWWVSDHEGKAIERFCSSPPPPAAPASDAEGPSSSERIPGARVGELAVLQVDPNTGIVLAKDGQWARNDDPAPRYWFFSSKEEAVQFCQLRREQNPNSEWVIYDWKGKSVAVYRPSYENRPPPKPRKLGVLASWRRWIATRLGDAGRGR